MLVEALYGQPYVSWQARMKEVLFRFGRLSCNAVRRPLQSIPEEDWSRMEALLKAVGLNEATLYLGQELDQRGQQRSVT